MLLLPQIPFFNLPDLLQSVSVVLFIFLQRKTRPQGEGKTQRKLDDYGGGGCETRRFRSLFYRVPNSAMPNENNGASLKSYAHDDTSVGSWMMGVQATYIDDSRLCCSSIKQDKVCSLA
uniref:Uncharacterized protein n=1 Tax=Populus trichocarpa TaxID=3694 RepID=A9PFS9_POPTR|nr:unknown [Populus trichocarpa]